MLEYDLSGKIVSFNKRAQQFFGYSETEILGKDVSILVPLEKQNKNVKALPGRIHSETAKDPVDAVAHINENVLRDGRRAWISWRSRTVKSADGKSTIILAAGQDVSYHRKTQDSLDDLERIISSISDGVGIADKNGILTFINEQAARMLGYRPEEVAGRPIMDFVDEGEAGTIAAAFRERRAGHAGRYELKVKHKNGGLVQVSIFGMPRYDCQGSYVGSYTIITDITERKRAEGHISHINHTLRALGNANKSLLRASDEKTLLQDICRIIADDCGHSMVWIGFARHDHNKSIETAAQVGMGGDYLESINISWGENERSRSPMGTCIRTGEVRLCRDIQSDPDFAIWRQIAAKYGYASAAAFPLKSEGVTFGAIGIYSQSKDGFPDDEVALLQDLADNLAYGITSLRLREEHQRSETGLLQAMQYLDNLLSFANSPIIVWDPEFKITRFNRAAERLTEMKALEAVGKDISIFAGGADEASLKSGLVGQRWKTVEVSLRRADKSVRAVVWNLANVYAPDDMNKAVATIALGQDITDRKLAEDQIKTYVAQLSREKRRIEDLLVRIADEKRVLDGIIENTEARIAYLDGRFNFVKANTAYCREYGRKASDIIGKNYFSFFADTDSDTKAILKKLRREGAAIKRLAIPHYNEHYPERGIAYQDLVASPVKDANGTVSGIVLLYLDATPRVRDEKNLALHSRRLQEMVNDLKKLQMAVENASDIIFTADVHGVITSVNNAALATLGYRPQELIGKPAAILGGLPNRQAHADLWEEIKKRKKPFLGEVANLKKNGQRADFELHVSPVADAHGEIISYIAIERDRTEAKAMERAKKEFISMASHQLRTPLATISLSAQMILNGAIGNVDAEARKQVSEIFKITHQMASLIDLFLNASRIELGRLEIDPHPVGLSEFVREIILPIRPLAAAKKIDLKSEVAADVNHLCIDRKVMSMVLENLLTNALKYTPAGGSVLLSVKKDESDVIFAISDNGVGVPKKQLHLLFNKMFRASNVGEASGYGLGLSMAKTVVEQSGGRIWAQTKQNQGSTFSISIPVSGMKRRKITFDS